jgi:hypothetical protein
MPFVSTRFNALGNNGVLALKMIYLAYDVILILTHFPFSCRIVLTFEMYIGKDIVWDHLHLSFWGSGALSLFVQYQKETGIVVPAKEIYQICTNYQSSKKKAYCL